MSGIVLDNGTLRLRLEPDFGARVSELTDLRTGRNWLVGGPAIGSPEQDAAFGVEQAHGWDECFPSAAPCRVAPWPVALRDHGEFWARPVEVTATSESATLVGQAGALRFQRTIVMDGGQLTLTYQVLNKGAVALPYLWSQHLLIAPEDGDRLDLPGIDSLDATFLSHGGRVLPTGRVAFPDPERDGLPMLDQVYPLATNFAAKFFAPVSAEAEARIVGRSGTFTLCWNAHEVNYLGLWLDYGGWPADAPVRQVSFAPTTAPTESLADAVAGGTAKWLQPGDMHKWTIAIRIEANEDVSHD